MSFLYESAQKEGEGRGEAGSRELIRLGLGTEVGRWCCRFVRGAEMIEDLRALRDGDEGAGEMEYERGKVVAVSS